MSGSSLTAKLVLTGDNKGIVTAAEGAVVALDQVKHKAQEAGAAAAAASGEFNVNAAALRGQAEAAAMSNTAIAAGGEAKAAEVVRLTQMAAAGEAVTSRVHAMSAAHAEYNATIAQARGLLAANIITQAEYAEVVAASSAQLALARANTDADTAAMIVNAEACQALSLGLRGMNLEAGAAGMGLDRLETNLAKLGRFGGVSRGVISRTRAGLAAIPEFVEAFPIVTAVAATAAALGVMFAAEQSYEASIGRLNVTLQAHGLLVTKTSGTYLSLAADVGDAAKVSERSARTIEATFANANLSPDLWKQVAAMSRDYASVLGTEIPDAAQKAAEGLSKPYEWAAQLTEQYGLFDQATLQHIRDLEQSGQKQAAQSIVTDRWADRIKGAANQTIGWAKAWDAASRAVSHYWDEMGKHLFPGDDASLPSQIDALKTELADAQRGVGKFRFGGGMNMFDWQPPRPVEEIAADIARVQQQIVDRARAIGDDEAKNRESNEMSSYFSGLGMSVYDQRLADIAARRKRAEAAAGNGVPIVVNGQQLSLKQQETLLDQEQAKVLKEKAQAQLSLNDAEKQHYERVQDLIKGAPLVISQGSLDARTAIGRAEAYRKGTAAFAAFNDQQDIAKATLPYMIELTYAHGEAAEKLKKIIADVTAEKTKELAADKALAAMQDIDQQIGSASGTMSNGLEEARSAQNKKTIEDWYQTQKKALAGASKDSDAYVKLELLHSKKLQDDRDEDLRNHQDWVSGIIRGNQEVLRSNQDWASKSEAFVTGWDRASEDAFVSFAKTGKFSFGDLTDFVVDQFARMAYQRYVAGTMNAIGGGILDVFDGILGISGSGGASTSIWKELGDSVLGGIFHGGGEVGAASSSRSVPVAAFYGARRYHGGGPVFGPDEVPIIAKRREVVLNEDQQQRSSRTIDAWSRALSQPTVVQLPAGGTMGSQPPKVEVHNHGEPLSVASQKYDPASNTLRVDLRRDVGKTVSASIAAGDADKALKRFGAAPILRRRS